MMNEGFGEGTPADDEWSEKKDIYEMCPHEDEGAGMEIDLPMGVEMGAQKRVVMMLLPWPHRPWLLFTSWPLLLA